MHEARVYSIYLVDGSHSILAIVQLALGHEVADGYTLNVTVLIGTEDGCSAAHHALTALRHSSRIKRLVGSCTIVIFHFICSESILVFCCHGSETPITVGCLVEAHWAATVA